MTADQRLQEVVLDERTLVRRSPDVEQERKVAIYDLLRENVFSPVADAPGPFGLHLSIEDNRLIFDIRAIDGGPIHIFGLALGPFRRIIKEYLMVCDSYYDAIKTESSVKIEAIDMGRRGLHTDAAELLIQRLTGKVGIDLETSRRLFTLICVLHIRG
ncbi:MAG: UPF0262 family protein [Alphaproteobacteria bacterium]|jgi:uncharacterized protein (UPF0262 family)|nr:UPF0262 family protein [Alphaproteobacteria bacterium]